MTRLRQAVHLLGLPGKRPHEPPTRRALWLLAVLCVLGLALMLATSAGLIHDIGVGLFGGTGGAWLTGRKRREDVKRSARLDPN